MGNRNREYWAPVREAELRSRLDAALGKDYAPSWAATVALQGLGSRCVDEALRAGVPCKEIWRAVWAELEKNPPPAALMRSRWTRSIMTASGWISAMEESRS